MRERGREREEIERETEKEIVWGRRNEERRGEKEKREKEEKNGGIMGSTGTKIKSKGYQSLW